MKSLIISKIKLYSNNFHFFLIPILVCLLGFNSYIFFILLAIYLIFVYFKTKLILPILLIILLFVIRYLLFLYFVNLPIDEESNLYILNRNDNSYEGYIGFKKIIIYGNNLKYKPGDIIKCKLKINDISKKNYSEDFDYKLYLYSKNTNVTAYIEKEELISNSFSIYSIKYYYLNYLKSNLCLDSYNYVSALVFGNNQFENELKDSFSALGISHIIAISGMHILFLNKFLKFILFKLFGYYKDLIPNFIIFIYLLIIGFPLSSVRALLFLIIGSLSNKSKVLSKLDILSISCLIMLFINPFYGYNTGFLLSFIVSFVLIFKDDIIKNSNNKIIDSYKTYFLIFLFTLPLVINMSNRISLISLLLSSILSTIISFIILPLSYVLAIIPISDFIFKYIFIFLNQYLINISNYNFMIPIKSFNIYLSSIYYLMLFVFIYSLIKKKFIIFNFSLLISYLLIILSFRYINPIAKITFINCGQGDSSLIEAPYSKEIIVIDCYNSYEFLRRQGIYNIDYLILSHSDNDHIGDYKEILNDFNVRKIIYPKYDLRFEELLVDYDNKIGIDDNYKINDYLNINILGPINSYDDPNSNSIVIKLNIYNTSILYTGDMTEKEEIDVINKYQDILESDILKVAHHGSDTSSSIDFLNCVNPKNSIISVGLNNSYNLPNDDIVERLKERSNLYMTKDSGNITLSIYDNKYKLSTYY